MQDFVYFLLYIIIRGDYMLKYFSYILNVVLIVFVTFTSLQKEEIIERLIKMQEADADIAKIAVMPESKKDVLTLLSATEEMVSQYADRPIVTMSMKGTGAISRISGEIFGSAITFGSLEKASAPGQVELSQLKTVLEIIHKNI